MESLNGPQEARTGTAGRSSNRHRMFAKSDTLQEVPARQHFPLCGPHEERQVQTVHRVV